MRRVLEAGAILLAPAVAAFVSPQDDTIPSAFITLRLPETADAVTTQDLVFRVDINESEDACGYGNVAINNHTLTETRTGSFSVDDGRTIDASWDLTCVTWNGEAQEQLLNFNVESVNGQAVEEVGLTLRFQQVAPVWISDVEGSASMTRVHSTHQPKPDCDDVAELDIDAEMAELDYLRWQLSEISHEIARKEHRLAEAFGMFRQRPLMIQDCDSLKCAFRALYQKVKHTASSLYAGGHFQGHHEHGPHGQPFGGVHAKYPHGDAPPGWGRPKPPHEFSQLNVHHNHTDNGTHPHPPPPHNGHPHEPPHGGPPHGGPPHGPPPHGPHGDHPHGPSHHGAEHRPSHFSHPPPFCKCDPPPHYFSGPPPHGQHMPPPPFGREHGHDGPKSHHHEEPEHKQPKHEHKEHSSAPGLGHDKPEDSNSPAPHDSHPEGHKEPMDKAKPKSSGQPTDDDHKKSQDEDKPAKEGEAAEVVDEQVESELRRDQALEDGHGHHPHHGHHGEFEEDFHGEHDGPHHGHHGEFEDFHGEHDGPHHGHHGEFEDFHGEHDGPHDPHHGHHDEFEEEDFPFEHDGPHHPPHMHDGPEDFPPTPFMDHDGPEPPHSGPPGGMMEDARPSPFGHDGPYGPPSAQHRPPHGGGPILLHIASIAASFILFGVFVRVLRQRCTRRPALELASQHRRSYSAAPWYKRVCFGPRYYQRLDDEEKEAMLRDCDSDCTSVEGDEDVVARDISSFRVAADVVGEMVMAEENRMMMATPSHSRHSSNSSSFSQIYTPYASSQTSSVSGHSAAAAAMFPDLHHDEEEEMLPAYQEADRQVEDDDSASELASSLMADGYRPGCSGTYTPPSVSGSQGASDILGDTKN